MTEGDIAPVLKEFSIQFSIMYSIKNAKCDLVSTIRELKGSFIMAQIRDQFWLWVLSNFSMTDRIVTSNDRGVGMALMKDQQQKFRVGSPSWQSGLARGMGM